MMNKLLLIIHLLVSHFYFSQCPNSLNGDNNNPAYVTVYVYNSSFQVIDTIPCNTNPSGQVNCDLVGGTYYSISNTDCFYNSVGNSIPDPGLPIELIYFAVSDKNSNNILEWATASEHNNDFFTVERSVDGSDWEEINKQAGAGNSTQEIRYQHTDESFKNEINYYRLTQTDFDGQFHIHNIVAIDNRSDDCHLLGVYDMVGRLVNSNSPGLKIYVYANGKIIKKY